MRQKEEGCRPARKREVKKEAGDDPGEQGKRHRAGAQPKAQECFACRQRLLEWRQGWRKQATRKTPKAGLSAMARGLTKRPLMHW